MIDQLLPANWSLKYILIHFILTSTVQKFFGYNLCVVEVLRHAFQSGRFESLCVKDLKWQVKFFSSSNIDKIFFLDDCEIPSAVLHLTDLVPASWVVDEAQNCVYLAVCGAGVSAKEEDGIVYDKGCKLTQDVWQVSVEIRPKRVAFAVSFNFLSVTGDSEKIIIIDNEPTLAVAILTSSDGILATA